VAKEKFKTHKSELNFNNEIGLCKTILAMPEETEVLILEMGMRGLGEIELLSKYSEPDITIITNVGTAHIGRLGSRENIAKAKCEIVNFQKENGILIAYEDELIKQTVHSSQLTFQPTFFSLTHATVLESKVGYSKFLYHQNEYELNIEGDYNIENSLAVIQMGLNLGMSPSLIKEGLKKYSPIEKRWQVEEIQGYKFINDSYNANPDSVKAALTTFLELYQPPLLVVLGDMGELGEDEIKYHQEIGCFLAEKAPKNVKILTVGTLANEISKKLEELGVHSMNFHNKGDVSLYILDNIKKGTTIILKASRSMKFEEIITNLKNN
jgi:UDP-N-acetylmuramoyl-tripeptide--D-alanyl-D-alanine ligase